MKPADPHDEMRDLTAFYALGSLTQREARSFEGHLNEGCRRCNVEVGEFEAVVSDLAFAAAGVEPPPGTFERVRQLTVRVH